MIDPANITRFDRTQEELEEFLLFCAGVVQANADTTARALDKLLVRARTCHPESPFEAVRQLAINEPLDLVLKNCGFGKYVMKSKSFIAICSSSIDLKTCTPDQLEELHGIGMKTSRFFILHSRRDAKVAVLDTHIMDWLAKEGLSDARPKHLTRKLYLKLEAEFLRIVAARGKTPAELDLEIWLQERKGK